MPDGIHVHIGAAELLQFIPMLIIVGYFWRVTTGHLVVSANPNAETIGKAMAFIY